MNKYLLKLLMASLLISLSACEFEMSDNGDLDGFWQLCTVDTLATGHSSDMRQIGIYWSVQMHILSIENKPRFIRFLFRFEQSDNQLRIYSPRLDNRISYAKLAADTSRVTVWWDWIVLRTVFRLCS